MSSTDRFEKPTGRSSTTFAPPAPAAGTRFSVCQEISVLWGDLDVIGHVNNTRYFAWFEEARLAYLRLIGVDMSSDATQKAVLASTTADFLRPVFWPDTVRVEGRTTRLGRTSLTMDYRVTSTSQQAIVATGSAVVVLVASSTNRPAPIPDVIRDAIRRIDPDARDTL
ncbi:acyl-CoA thioesterase [Polyangium jinanense]|uniref:Acyl-CoA thioesterase n=1 Tax=Polyangium jinanense TaxID=2829994 RepID=A0A9X3X9Q7_9BACT|nr:thioesterase family protein [Polyangium jinanense]MDC3961281.1 acyl-CoA thioesterase [Polyangium jinanense]MDC3984086.1 acyl-CoA thioesterase [Polyangium jinanense]